MTMGLAENKRLGLQQSSPWAPHVTSDTSGNRKEKSGNRTRPLYCQESYKSIFLGKAMRFCHMVPGQTADLQGPGRSASRGTLSGISQEGLAYSGRSLQPPPQTPSECSKPPLCTADTQRPGKHIIIFKRRSSLTNPEDVLSGCEHYSRLLGRHLI